MHKPPEVFQGLMQIALRGYVRQSFMRPFGLARAGRLPSQLLCFLLRQNPKHLYANLALLM